MHQAEELLAALGKGDASPGDLARFAAKVVADGDCWIWQAAHNGLGYGRFYYAGRLIYAHRFAFEQVTGRRLGKKYLCHACDTPGCVNPKHLTAGDQMRNMGDAAQKGRIPRGERHYGARLTAADVRAIRSRWADGEGVRVIATDYRIAKQTAWKIATRRAWRHVS